MTVSDNTLSPPIADELAALRRSLILDDWNPHAPEIEALQRGADGLRQSARLLRQLRPAVARLDPITACQVDAVLIGMGLEPDWLEDGP